MSFMLKILRGVHHPGLSQWVLNPMAREAEGHLTTHREDDVTTEAEIGVTQPQAKGCQRPPEEATNMFTSRTSRGSMTP